MPFDVDDVLVIAPCERDAEVIAPCERDADGNWNHTVIVHIRATELRRLGIHL